MTVHLEIKVLINADFYHALKKKKIYASKGILDLCF